VVGTERGKTSGMKRGRAPQRAALLLAAIVAMLLMGGSCAIAAADDQGESAESAPASAPLTAPGGPELEGERTATSQTFMLPGGALETRLYGSPVNYQDPEGNWQPIDEGFEELDNGRLTNGPNSFDVSLPERLGEDPVRLGIDGAWVTTELLGAEPQAVQPEDATATYESAGNGVDFEFANLADGLKEEIVLAGPSQPSSFQFELDASNGLTPIMRDDGSIQFREANGQGVVTLPAPVMSDSAEPTPATSRNIHYTLGPEVEGHWRLTVEADRDWLTQPDRSWPVRLDPTMTISSNLDCIIGGLKGQTGWIDCSAWGRKVDLVNYTPHLNSSEDGWQRGLLYLETSDLPANATVSSATFNIYSAEAAVSTSGAELLKTSKPWTWQASWSQYDGPTHLWTTEGGDTSESLGQVLTSQRGSQAGWWQFTLPAKTVEAEAAKAADLGTLLKLIDDKTRVCGPTSCTERAIAFSSSAATETASRPYLAVTYLTEPLSAPILTGSTPTSGNDNTPQIKGSTLAGSTVKLYTTSNCTGVIAGTGSAATLSSTGIETAVADNTTTTYYATATFGALVSPCSGTSVKFREHTPRMSEIVGLPLLDPLNRSEGSLSNGGMWLAPAWLTSTSWKTGQDTPGGWGPISSFPASHGAYWNGATFSESGVGDAVAITMEAAPGLTERYVALWLNMPSPGSTLSGYELIWTQTGSIANATYSVSLKRWSAGAGTVLASTSSVFIPPGTSLVLADTGGVVEAWKGSGASYSLILSASDGSYAGGYSGMEAAGNSSRSKYFRSGSLTPIPAKPAFTAVTPAAVANNNNPLIRGTTDSDATVWLYTNSGCTGTPVASGSAATFASPGLSVSVADNTKTTFYATAMNSYAVSACSTAGISYTEDSVPPVPPSLNSTNPPSPANNNSPAILGSGEVGSTVLIYTNGTCTGEPVIKTPSSSLVSGLPVPATSNTVNTYSAKVMDAASNLSACSSPLSYVEDSTLPTMSFDSDFSPTAPKKYTLHIHASDPGTVAPGVKAINLLLNGEAIANFEQSCTATQCPKSVEQAWSHEFSHPLDGSDRLTVLLIDKSGNTATAAFDLPSRVVQATAYSGNPATGGAEVAKEWAQLYTHNSRRVSPAETVTRGSAECPNEAPGKRCSFLRTLLSVDEDGTTRNRFSEAMAGSSGGQSISDAATLLYPSQIDFGKVVSSGALSSIIQPWQTPPPGAGAQYDQIISSNEASEGQKPGNWTFWVDHSSGLPIKASVQQGTESPQVSYYSYSPAVDEAGNREPSFFLQEPTEGAQCLSGGKLGGWNFNKSGFVYPLPEYSSAVIGANGLLVLNPEGAAVDGYEPRAELTSSGVELSAAPSDVDDLAWDVTEDQDQILEPVGGSVVVETPAGVPSAVVTSADPSTMSVVDGTPEGDPDQSGDQIVLEPESKEGASASVQQVAVEPDVSAAPCVTQADVNSAAIVHEEAMAARTLAVGSKPAGSGQTTPVVVWINPHPALKGVTVTDQGGACSTPHSKTFGEDGRVEFGGCPVGGSVTLTVPSSVSVSGTTYTTGDPTREFRPPSGGWRVEFNYQAQAPPPPPPPPPPAEESPWFTEPIIDLVEGEAEEGASSSEYPPIPIEPNHACKGISSRPWRSSTAIPDLMTAEASFRFRCSANAYMDTWLAIQKLERFDKSASKWNERNQRDLGGLGPGITNHGPYYITAGCRSMGSLLNGLPQWRSETKFAAFFERPGGISYADADTHTSNPTPLGCG
jgi:hypothetical protein